MFWIVVNLIAGISGFMAGLSTSGIESVFWFALSGLSLLVFLPGSLKEEMKRRQ